MSGISGQIVEQITHFPDVVENPAAAAAVFVAAGTLVLAQVGIHRKVQERYTVETPNAALLDATISDVRTSEHAGKKATRSRWSRIGSSILVVAGLGLAAGSYFGDMELETTTDNGSAHTVFVVDSSLSMLHTADMHSDKSRLNITKDALSAADETGSAAIVEFAANNRLTAPMTQEWNAKSSSLGKNDKANPNKIDPNGGLLVPALELADSLLPQQAANQKAHGETVIIISDGTIQNTPTEITQEIEKLKSQKINVKTIVTGTEKSSYNTGPGTPMVDSGVAPEVFVGAGKDNTKIVDSQEALTKAINQSIDKSGTSDEKRRWLPPIAIGLVAAAVGIAMDYYQRAKRII